MFENVKFDLWGFIMGLVITLGWLSLLLNSFKVDKHSLIIQFILELMVHVIIFTWVMLCMIIIIFGIYTIINSIKIKVEK